MKKITFVLIVSFITITKLSAQWDSMAAVAIITAEAIKIQYVFEGEVISIKAYAGDTTGARFAPSNLLLDPSSNSYYYRNLKGGPICFSIATIKVCQIYKGIGITDTIKILTFSKEIDFTLKINGMDTVQQFIESMNPSRTMFFKPGMEGFKAVFFGYNHTYSGVSNQIKILSRIGNIDFHTWRYNPNSSDPNDRVFASSTAALAYAHSAFYSRQELYDFLENMPLLGLNVHGPNSCLPASVPAEKKKCRLNRKTKN